VLEVAENSRQKQKTRRWLDGTQFRIIVQSEAIKHQKKGGKTRDASDQQAG